MGHGPRIERDRRTVARGRLEHAGDAAPAARFEIDDGSDANGLRVRREEDAGKTCGLSRPREILFLRRELQYHAEMPQTE